MSIIGSGIFQQRLPLVSVRLERIATNTYIIAEFGIEMVLTIFGERPARKAQP